MNNLDYFLCMQEICLLLWVLIKVGQGSCRLLRIVLVGLVLFGEDGYSLVLQMGQA